MNSFLKWTFLIVFPLRNYLWVLVKQDPVSTMQRAGWTNHSGFRSVHSFSLNWSGLVLFEKRVLPVALITWMQPTTIFMYTWQIWYGDKRTTKQAGELASPLFISEKAVKVVLGSAVPTSCRLHVFLQCELWIIPKKRPKWNNYKKSCQKRFSGFCPLRGVGVPPFSAKLFWAQWLSVKGGGEPPNSVKEKIC